MKLTSLNDYRGDKYTTCCFTGHRSKDLPFEADVHKQGMKCLLSMLQLMIEEAVADGYRTFISGMAQGVDMYCAEIVHNLSVSGKLGEIRLVCAIPYAAQQRELNNSLDRYRYSMLVDTCDEKVIVSQAECRDKYKLRNNFMVENSSRIIGAYKEKQRGSGTLQTINMAKRAGLEMKIISLDNNPQLYVDTDQPMTDSKITLLG